LTNKLTGAAKTLASQIESSEHLKSMHKIKSMGFHLDLHTFMLALIIVVLVIPELLRCLAKIWQ
jgi:hypothetical protein